MVSVCLPSDALLQHLLSYLGFSYLGLGVSLHGCSSKTQLLLLTLDEGYLLTAALPDLQRGIAPLGPPGPARSHRVGLVLPATAPGLGRGKIQIKTTIKCNFILSRWAKIKQYNNTNAVKNVSPVGVFSHTWWDYKLIQPS